MTFYQCIKFHSNPFQTFKDMHAPDKLFIAEIVKGSNIANTDDRVMVLVICHSVSVSSFIKLPSIFLEICSRQKCDRWMNKGTTKCSPFQGA